MFLASFGDVYMCYAHVVKANASYTNFEYTDFPHQPYKLLEAYSRAWGVMQDDNVGYTSEWERQSGATTTAVALAICEPNAVILNADYRMARHVSEAIFRAFPKEEGNVKKGSALHRQVWPMTGLHSWMAGRKAPSLVIVDSETAYRKDRDQGVETVRNRFNCPVLVLDGSKPVV